MKKWVAILDDEEDIIELQKISLVSEGFDVKSYTSSKYFLDYLLKEKFNFNLIILDIMMPDNTGVEILKMLRTSPSFEFYKNTPVIMVSAKDTEFDKVLCLELGADDYISKPFSPREFAARVRAVIRRSLPEETGKEFIGGIYQLNGLVVDEKKYKVLIDDEPIDLTTAEFKILSTLIKRKGWVFDRDKIIDIIWNGEKYVTDRTVDVHITHLRDKLKQYGNYIKTIRGVGYKLDDKE